MMINAFLALLAAWDHGVFQRPRAVPRPCYAPRHPYTKALLASIPRLGTKEPLYAIPGQPPDLSKLPVGCSFHPRCPHATRRCRGEEPPERRDTAGATARCWLAEMAEVTGEAMHA